MDFQVKDQHYLNKDNNCLDIDKHPRKKRKTSNKIIYDEKSDIDHDDQLSLEFLMQHEGFFQSLCAFTTIDDIYNLCEIRISLGIGISSISNSSQIVRSLLLSIRDEDDYEYVRSVSVDSCNDIRFKELLKQYIRKDCIFAHKHAFTLGSKTITKNICIRLNEISTIPWIPTYLFSSLKKIDYFEYL